MNRCQFLVHGFAMLGYFALAVGSVMAGQPEQGHRGPPFPRIANVYGTSLTPGGPRVAGV